MNQLYCPQCDAEVAPEALRCTRCRAKFNLAGGWRPVPKSTDLKEATGSELGQAALLWALWGAGVLASGGIVFLWLVFGAAGAQGGPIAGFLSVTGLVCLVIVVGSVVAMIHRKRVLAVFIVWVIPVVLAALMAMA